MPRRGRGEHREPAGAIEEADRVARTHVSLKRLAKLFPVERLLASSSTSFCPPPSFTTKQAEASEVRVESLRQARHRSSCQGQRYCWLAGVVTAGVRLDW